MRELLESSEPKSLPLGPQETLNTAFPPTAGPSLEYGVHTSAHSFTIMIGYLASLSSLPTVIMVLRTLPHHSSTMFTGLKPCITPVNPRSLPKDFSAENNSDHLQPFTRHK